MTNTNATTSSPPTLLGTGIEGLDDILYGGFSAGGLYSIEGDTGAGKTTLCLQFLLEGGRQEERVLLVTLSESAADLRNMARSHGWSLDGVEILELVASDRELSPDSHYTMFHPSEVELTETTRAIIEAAERIKPARVDLDPGAGRVGPRAVSGLALHDVSPVGGRADGDHARHHRGGRADQARSDRARFSRRAPLARAVVAAVPAADPRAEELLQQAQRDRADGRRSARGQ